MFIQLLSKKKFIWQNNFCRFDENLGKLQSITHFHCPDFEANISETLYVG